MTSRPARRRLSPTVAAGLKFLVVGGGTTVVTIGVFNLLSHVGSPPVLADQPIIAYGVGLVVGLTVNYFGNRFWAFEAAPPGSFWRQLATFLAVNAVAFAIPAACLAVSRYVLGLDSALADNIAANVVGLVLATATRWCLYRSVVFSSRA